MATAANTIKQALRKLRVIGQGESPTSDQQTDALTELNAWLNEMIGFGSSIAWKTTYCDASMDLGWDYPAQRVLVRHPSSAITITLPEGTASAPLQDGFRFGVVDVSANAATYNITIARNGLLIAGSAANATISSNGTNRVYMFRADLGDWKLAADLATSDSLPFPSEFDLPVALILAHRLGGEYGASLTESDFHLMRGGKTKLRNRYCVPPIMYPESAASNIGGQTQRTGLTGQDQSVA
jgi:hypothetical protein